MDNIKVVLWNVFHSAWTPTILNVCITMAVTIKTYSLQWYYAIPGNLIKRCLNAFLELYIIKHLKYPFNYDTNVLKLRGLTYNLEAQRDRMQDSVDDADDNNENVYKNVRKWLSDSETAIQEARAVINAKDEAAKLFLRLFPNWIARYKLSKKADEKVFAMNLLVNQEMGLHPVSHHPRRRQHLGQPIYYTELRLSIRKEVMEALKDPNLNRVGVWGMAGVGKSTLVKQVHDLASKDKQFEDVVFVPVSEKSELGEIQKVIADGLGVKFSVEDINVRAGHLSDRIKDKKILIIFDNIWQKIDLHEIGIPAGDEGKDCKILLTSRDKRVLLNEMGKEKVFELQVLTHEEACIMFANIVPHAKDPKFDAIAKEVIKKCAGLPLLINLNAGYLSNCKELETWEEKLHQLSNFKDGEIDLKVRESLKSSYHNLDGNEIKSLFLLCALCGQSNIPIQYLLRYSIGLGFLTRWNTVSDARVRVHSLITNLQDCCLLMKGDMDGYVKLHDIVRDAALSIAWEVKHAFICQSGDTLMELPNKDCTQISLTYCDFQEFTGSNSKYFRFECPNAELLLLLTEHISLEVSNSFFNRVRKLKVLDFTGIRFRCLPPLFLSNLQTLCLHRCHLDTLATIGQLTQLKVLSFVDSYMVKLPKELEQLTRLKILDLTNCFKLKVIPANFFSKLTRLEELYMGNSFIEWEAEGNTRLEELEHLSCLTTLEMQIKNCKMIPKYLFFSFKYLQNYRIVIGDVWDWRFDSESSRMLKLKFDTSIHSNQGVLKLLKETDHLYLDEVQGIENVLYDFDGDGLWRMKHLSVQNDRMIQHIVNSTDFYSFSAFPVLQSLILNDLASLENLCNGPPVAGSFSKLKGLEVRNCKKLATLFLLSCSNQEDIIQVKLAQLCSLTLVNLPSLRSFCNKNERPLESHSRNNESVPNDAKLQKGIKSLLNRLVWPWIKRLASLRRLIKTKEAQLESLARHNQLTVDEPSSIFNGLVSLPKLKNLTIHTVRCKKIWQDHLSLTSSNLTSLIVERSHKLRYLFTSSMVRSLSQLKKIEIRNCKLIKEIILTEETEKKTEILFPKLDSLRLAVLPKLSRFCSGHPIEFQSLKGLYIISCQALTTFVACTPQVNSEANNTSETQCLFNGMVGFPELEELLLSRMENLENMWHGQLLPHSFCKLKALKIQNCKKLLKVFPPEVLHRFRRLERLSISYSDLLQEIFQFQELNTKDTDAAVEFKLRELKISSLGELKMIWSKDSPKVFCFQELQSVEVSDCDDLKYIFPHSIATRLPQLHNLAIQGAPGRCKLEEIVAKSETGGSDTNFKFPQLASLTLHRQSKLKCLYPGRHSAEWPRLKCLKLIQCEDSIMFGSEIRNPSQDAAHGGEGGSQDTESFQPLFMFEKFNRNLEELALHHNDLIRIQNSERPANLFSKVKVLTLQSLTPQSCINLFGFLKTLNSLRELVVDRGNFEKLFSYEDADYVPLRHLSISKVSNLKHIWEQDARLIPDTQYLKTLTIEYCSNLSKIVHSASSYSFRNLAALKVNHCYKLKSLLTVSTAKTMVNLTEMSLAYNDTLTEVVENDGDQTQDEVVFEKLRTLRFYCLTKLTSFYLGRHAFSFPLLEEVYVDSTTKMQSFSTGKLSTPKLRSVRESRSDNQFWERNLNDTITYLLRNPPQEV